GVNSQRLLVTGYRVLPDLVKAPDDKLQWPLWMTLFVIALVGCAVILATMVVTDAKRKRGKLDLHAKHLSILA
ncbi:hypothetical protein HMPREF1579_01430, partial [Gardnerella vaginalis JCP8066]